MSLSWKQMLLTGAAAVGFVLGTSREAEGQSSDFMQRYKAKQKEAAERQNNHQGTNLMKYPNLDKANQPGASQAPGAYQTQKTSVPNLITFDMGYRVATNTAEPGRMDRMLRSEVSIIYNGMKPGIHPKIFAAYDYHYQARQYNLQRPNYAATGINLRRYPAGMTMGVELKATTDPNKHLWGAGGLRLNAPLRRFVGNKDEALTLGLNGRVQYNIFSHQRALGSGVAVHLAATGEAAFGINRKSILSPTTGGVIGKGPKELIGYTNFGFALGVNF